MLVLFVLTALLTSCVADATQQHPQLLHNTYLSTAIDLNSRVAGAPNTTSNAAGNRLTNANGVRIYRTAWRGKRRWVGHHWWANPIYDWRLQGDSVLASAAAGRTLCFLPVDITQKHPAFTLSVSVRLRARGKGLGPMPASVAAGFIIGRRSSISDVRRALLSPTTGVNAMVTADGRLVLGRIKTKLSGLAALRPDTAVRLTLTSKPMGKVTQLTFTARRKGLPQPAVVQAIVPSNIVTGGVALLSDGPGLPPEAKRTISFAFKQFVITAHKDVFHDDRTIGPVAWTQYTLNAGTLRIQAQLMPMESGTTVELWVSPSLSRKAPFRKESSVRMDRASYTATFTVKNWVSTRPHRYEVRMIHDGDVHVWGGRIRKEPERNARLRMGVFSCDRGYVFPHSSLVQQVENENPDMVFFLGDQIYESYGRFGVALDAKINIAILDFLYKYMRFGLTWRSILRDRPSVIIPDDHDVFHPNLWGDGGRAMHDPQARAWSSGGYLMPPQWLKVVEKVHVGHLPDPAVDITLPLGIKPYFTSFTYAGIGFAILEDRKFKSAPGIGPTSSLAAGKNLLGSAQEAFLTAWTRDWTMHEMKVAVSQTAFAKATTHVGALLRRTSGITDSGSWPREARNRVVRLLGDANVFTMHGDQHLGMLFQQGINEFRDAGYSFMVPGIANGFPRAWWPGVNKPASVRRGQKFTGKFIDDAGNPLTVLAVANPDPDSGNLPLTDPQPERIAYRKGSGFGIVDIDKLKKSARVSLFRVGANNEQFDGFPQTIVVGGKPTDKAASQQGPLRNT